MTKAINDFIEPALTECLLSAPNTIDSERNSYLGSIAISLKRIADALTTPTITSHPFDYKSLNPEHHAD